LAGGLKAISFGETLESFSPGNILFIEEKDQYRSLVVKDFHPMGRLVLLWFEELNTKNEVEPLVGRSIWKVKPEVLKTDKPGTYFVYQLINLKVIENNQCLGIVSDIIEGPAYDYLQIIRDNREFLLPFIRIFVKNINLLDGFITVECPEGFWQ